MFLPLYPRQSQPLSSSSSSSSLSSLTPSSTLAPTSSFSDSSGTLLSSTAPSTSDPIASSTSITPTSSSQFASTSSAISTSTSVTPSPSSFSSPWIPPSTPLTPSSGFSLFTLTSTYVTDIGGTPTTVVTPIITALRTSTSPRASPRIDVIVGSAIGGLVAIIIALTSLFVMRRRSQRRRYWEFARSKQYPSRVTFLAGEEMDLPHHPSPPLIYSDREPFMNRSWRNVRSSQSPDYSHSHSHSAGSSRTQSPPLSPPPRLLRPRASESGSIFQENIWPPPSAASQLMDPLTHAAQSVDLGRIIDDVMGPERASPPDISDTGLLLTVHEHGQEREQDQPQREQEQMREHENEDDVVAMLPLTLARTTSDEPALPASASILPQPPRWLSRSPNPSPKSSPLHKGQAI